jgi:hypothetical protein
MVYTQQQVEVYVKDFCHVSGQEVPF